MKFARNWGEVSRNLEEQSNKYGFQSDPRLYKLKFNQDGTFAALIRFLPAKGDSAPFLKLYNHNFKGRGGKYVEECPTTIGAKCPVCDDNSIEWKKGEQGDMNAKQIARDRGRGKTAISNILVINDSSCPANNGKVFLYRYGKTIFVKVDEARSPDPSLIKTGAVKPIEIFDYYTGANFRLIGKKEHRGDKIFPDYKSSFFETTPSAIGSDDIIAPIDAALYDLTEFQDPKRFKSYDELKVLFDRAWGNPFQVAVGVAVGAPVKTSTPTPAASVAATSAVMGTVATPLVQSSPICPPLAPVPTPVTTEDAKLEYDADSSEDDKEFWKQVKQD